MSRRNALTALALGVGSATGVAVGYWGPSAVVGAILTIGYVALCVAFWGMVLLIATGFADSK